MTTFLIFIFGLIIGSFLNAVIYRLHEGKSFLFSRSICPHCHHELSALDLIPVISFLFLKGRCRYCGKKISWQYPIIELITAIVFVLVFVNGQSLIVNSIFACFLIVIAVYDLKHYLILDKVLIPASILALVWLIVNGQQSIVNGLLGVLFVSGFFLLQYLFSKGRWIGFGDVKLGVFLGLTIGWPQVVVLLILSYFLGAIVGVGLIVSGKKHLGSHLPFGTFLSASAIIVLIYGQDLLNWYLKLVGF